MRTNTSIVGRRAEEKMRASSRHLRMMAIGAVAAAALSAAGSAQAQSVPLFTTQDDWSSANGWSGDNGSTIATAPSSVFDADLSSTNGGGNFTAPGGAATVGPGSLQVNFGGDGYGEVAGISNEQGNNSFISAFDPGASGNTAVPYSGTVQLEYTQPAIPVGGYFQIGIFLQYSGDGYYGPFLSSTQVAVSAGTNTTGENEMLATIPYNIVGNTFNGFGFGIFVNTNAAAGTFYVDNLVEAPTFQDETSSWIKNGSGVWENGTNWSSSPDSGSIPGGAGSKITFDNDGGAITVNPTVTLSSAVSATLLTFGNASGGTAVNYTIASGAAGAGITVSAEIDADSGSHAINVPVSTSASPFYFGIAQGASLSIPSFADSNYGLITVTSPLSNQTAGGTLSLAATLHCSLTDNGTAITFLPGSGGFLYSLNVNTGSVVTLGANTWNTNSIGSDGTGEIIVPNGGTLYTGEYQAGTVTYSGTFGGGGSIVVGEGGSTDTTPSTLALYGNNSAFTGTITAGSTSAAGAYTLAVGSASSLGGGSVILDGGILQAIGGFVGTQNVVVTANGGTIDTDGPGVGANGTAITLGTISSTATGAMLSKINTGILTTTSIRGVGLSIAGGTSGAASTVQIAQNNGTVAGAQAGVSVLKSLTIENTGSYTSTLDLTNNSLIIQNGGTANTASAAVASTVAAEIASGRNNNAQGLWTGTGITSSLAAANPTLTAVGMIYNDNGSGTPLKTSFEGQTVSDGDVLVKYTYDGDANLDGTVNGSDYTIIDNAYNVDQAYLAAHPSGAAPLTGWQNGDFNYDGQINGDDYALIDNAFNMEGSVTFAGTSAGPAEMIAGDTEQVASPAVPEPTTLTLIGMGAGGLMVRRRRRN